MAEEHPSSSDLWKELDTLNEQEAIELEADYQKIEGYNRRLLNQLAGLVPSTYVIEGKVDDDSSNLEAEESPKKLEGRTISALLFLRPDYRDKLIDQGEPMADVAMFADPHTIRGEVPERTKQLINDLLSGLEAEKDTELSKPNIEVFMGNLANEPIEVHIINNHYIRTTLDGDDKGFDSLTVRCYVPQSRLDEIMGKTKTTLNQESSDSPPSEKPNNEDEQSGKEGPNANDTSNRPLKRRNLFYRKPK